METSEAESSSSIDVAFVVPTGLWGRTGTVWAGDAAWEVVSAEDESVVSEDISLPGESITPLLELDAAGQKLLMPRRKEDNRKSGNSQLYKELCIKIQGIWEIEGMSDWRNCLESASAEERDSASCAPKKTQQHA